MNVLEIDNNKNNIVKKHNDIILNARYKMSEQGIKLATLLISMVRVDDEDFQEYIIMGKDFKELVNCNSKDTVSIMERIGVELISSKIRIKKDSSNFVTYFAVSYEYALNSGYLKLTIHPELKPYFLKLQKNFTQYDISNILKLKSGYVIRLYELVKSKYSEYMHYHPNATSFSFALDLDWMRDHFNVPDSYLYKDIRVNIIEKAVKQFKEKTDIQFTYKEIKLGRKVVTLQITVKSNDRGSNDYLRHKKAFIAHLRANYVNFNILQAEDKHTKAVMMISVAPDGKLYDKKGLSFNATRSNEMWETLYQMAKDDKLICLKQGKLFS